MTEIVLPFSDAELIGPDDRPRADWQVTMYQWQAYVGEGVRQWLDQMAGSAVEAIQVAPKPEAGVLYARACLSDAPKAHPVHASPAQRSASFSLYAPLRTMGFPRIGPRQRAVFQCWPETYGETKVLVIQVRGYRVEGMDQELQQVAAGSQNVT